MRLCSKRRTYQQIHFTTCPGRCVVGRDESKSTGEGGGFVHPVLLRPASPVNRGLLHKDRNCKILVIDIVRVLLI